MKITKEMVNNSYVHKKVFGLELSVYLLENGRDLTSFEYLTMLLEDNYSKSILQSYLVNNEKCGYTLDSLASEQKDFYNLFN